MRTSRVISALTGLTLLSVSAALSGQPARFEQPIVLSDGAIQLTLVGPSEKAHRIEVSSDLKSWTELLVLGSTNSLKVFTAQPSATARFFRAIELTPISGFSITSFEPTAALPGEEILINGVFDVPANDNDKLVQFGSATAEVLSASQVQWRVRVPDHAESGPLKLLTTTTNAQSQREFTLLTLAPVMLTPPPGMPGAEFEVVNLFGGTVTNEGTAMLRVRSGITTVNMAVDTQTNRFLYGLTLEKGKPVALSVESTAQTLVFMSPLLVTLDPLQGARTLETIRTNQHVLELAALLSPLYAQSGDPYTNSAVVAKYAEAINSVAGLPRDGALQRSGANEQADGLRLFNVPSGDYLLDMEYTMVLNDTDDGKSLGPYARRMDDWPGPRIMYLNPVDWRVLVQEIHADIAFPRGQIDFDAVVREGRRLEQFPLKGSIATNKVEANLVGERFNPVKWVIGELADAIQDAFLPSEELIRLPERDGIYVLRAIGPGINDSPEADFVWINYPDERTKVVAANLMAAVMDFLGLLIDLEMFEGKDYQELLAKLAAEVAKAVPELEKTSDLGKVALDLVKFVIQEIGDKLISDWEDKKDQLFEEAKLHAARAKVQAARGSRKLAEYTGKLAEDTRNLASRLSWLNAVLSMTDKAGGAAQVLQRQLGILVTTPMETALVVVGEPFKIEPITIDPTVAAPGGEVQIHFQSTALARMFTPGLEKDSVDFEGREHFSGQVIEIKGTPENQTLRVRIPDTYGAQADGEYSVFVNTQGRRGRVAFRISSVPMISDVAPTVGFAAVDDFAGAPYDGSELQVKGALFNSFDQFFFGGAGQPEATMKTGRAGNVRLNIPKGAQTSFLRVVHKNNLGEEIEALGPMVTVLKDPVIKSVVPDRGHVGTPVTLDLSNVVKSSALIRVQFAGAQPQDVAVFRDGTVRTAVPSGAVTGALTVLTPGGSASHPFSVSPDPPVQEFGSVISVGAHVSFARAMQFANGHAFPQDDDTDPPLDEGDSVSKLSTDGISQPAFLLGPNFKNRIEVSGTVDGDFEIDGVGNIYSGGTFTGAIVISGTSNSFSGCTFKGPVTITGTGNIVGSKFMAQLIVEGDGNEIRNLAGTRTTFQNVPGHAAIVKGDHNRFILCNLYTNSGDGIRIEGAKFNEIEVADSLGNSGNGVTLTGGAAHNTVKFQSGRRHRTAETVDSGNKGHGIALLGDAHDNSFSAFTLGASGNALDGVYLDGPGVVGNEFGADLKVTHNGRNGITITNNASNNRFGVADLDGNFISPLDVSFNKANGLLLSGAKFSTAAIIANGNMLNGVLVSDVQDPPSGTILYVITGSLGPGNGHAGLRLEKAASGVRAEFRSDLRQDKVGIELDGENVQANVLNGTIRDCLGDAVVIRNARRNDLTLRVEKSAGAGVVLFGGQKNILRIDGIQNNAGNGIHCIGGTENQIVMASPPFTATVRGNRNGLVLEQGATRHSVDNVSFQSNREHGILIDGPGTVGNRFTSITVVGSGQDGLRVQNKASGVSFGSGEDNPFFPIRSSSFHSNTNAAIRVTGDGTHDITIAGCFIGSRSAAPQPAGIVVENRAANVTLSHNTLFRNVDGVVVKDSAHDVSIVKSIFDANVQNGIFVSNGSRVSIGAPDSAFANTIYSNLVSGIKLSGSATTNCVIQNNLVYDNAQGIVLAARAQGNRVGPGNIIDRNPTGISVEFAFLNSLFRNVIRGSQSVGVRFADAASGNNTTANTIIGNGIGVHVSGTATVGNSIINNSITGNGGNGIRLVQGGNKQITAPAIDAVQGNAIAGTTTAPDGSRIEIFQDPFVEGEALIATAHAVNGRFRAPIDIELWKIGLLFNITATVTDLEGNTSELNSMLPPEHEPEKIVFTSTRVGNPEIYMIDPPSASAINLTQHAAADHSPALAGGNHCDELVFVSDRTGNSDIFGMPARQGESARQLTTNPANDYSPEWLEPCASIVFVSDRDGNPEIYTMKPDGSDVTRLTTHSAIDRNPKPSHDGRILFESNRSGQFGIWIMNRNGTGQEPLVQSSFEDTQAIMSPDGAFIAFVSKRDGNPELYVMRADGTGLLRLTHNSGIDKDPAWTRDSSRIVFASQISDGAELFVIGRAGGSPQPLGFSPGENSQPSIGR